MATGIEIEPAVPPSTYQFLGETTSIAPETSKCILISCALHITRGERVEPGLCQAHATEIEKTQEKTS
jgi:hypothetical protein